MSYLPIIVKKSRPFLEALSSEESSQRGVCPRGKLLAFLDPSGHLRVHHLSDDSQKVIVDSESFVGCQWVLPCRTNQDCVSEPRQQQKSEILAVSSSLDFHWFSVCEVERVASPEPREPRDGSSGQEDEREEGNEKEKEGKAKEESGEEESVSCELVIERLAVLKKKELGAELRHFDCSDIVDSVRLLGSYRGQVLMLVNSLLVCSLAMDTEFDRVALHDCVALEISFDPYDDDDLPQRAGLPVSFTFQSPLLFAMTLDGVIFIYNISSAMCIGIVSATQYCQYACGRQPDSEELLSTISASYFRLSWVSPDLTQLVVSTYDNNLLFINLPEYFQIFSNHYHPSFVRSFQNSQLNDQASFAKRSDISEEEAEDQIKYAGAVTTPTGYLDKPSTDFAGQHAWMNRVGRLKQSVGTFQPSEGRYLSFHQTSNLQLNSGIELNSQKSQLRGKSGGTSESQKVEVQPTQSAGKAWYEEPISHTIAVAARSSFGSWESFGQSFITGMKKSVPEHRPAGSHSNASDVLSPSHHSYKNYCVLPSASFLLDSESTVIHVEFASGLVVAFYGQTGGEERAKPRTVRTSQGQFVNNRVTVPITGVALYNVSSLTYSIRRLPQASWLVPSSHPDQLLCLANEQSLTVATFNLSQEEFVGKVLMYGNASIAEEVCQLNRWDNCSLPINALETALELRQLDTLAFFLRSRESDNSESDGGQQLEPTLAKKQEQSDSDEALYLPPLPPDQLDTVVKLLIDAINKNYKEEHYCQFASHLLIMTLGFLTRMIKSQTLLEEHVAETMAGQQDTPREGGGETSTAVSPMKRTVSGTSAEGLMSPLSLPEISVSSMDLASYVHQLRDHLPKASALIGGRPPDGGVAERARAEMEREASSRSLGSSESYAAAEFMDRSITSRWDKQKPKEVIRDALLRGCLPLAQSYLIQRGPQDVGRGFGRSISLVEAIDDYSGSSHYDASLGNMMTTATGFVMEALDKKNIKQATSILTQMGLNVRTSLRHICFHTLSRQLRDFLASELSSRDWLSDEELQTLEYLHILERFYPNESYEEAHNLQPSQPRKNNFQSTSLPVMPGMISRPTYIPSIGNLQELYPETFGGDHALSWDSSSVSSSPMTSFSSRVESGSLYLQVPLAVVLEWDLATRQRLLFEGFLLNGQADGLDCEKLVNKEYVFNYYVRHNDITGAVQFVTSRVPPLENPTPCPSHILSLSSNMPHSTRYLSNTLLDELARHGVLLPQELSSLPDLLNRLGRVHSLFSQPHPLTKTASHHQQGEREPTTSDDGAIISVEAFHRSFLKYLMENRFCSLMYHYLDCYGLALDEVSISGLGLDSPDQQPWVQVMLKYRMAAQNPNDPTAMFLASLSCGNLLLSSGSGGSGERMSVMRMLRDGRTLMAIATLMYAPVPLKEAMNAKNSGQPWYVDPTTFRRAIAAYPSLQAAIFPPPPTTATPAQSQDISLYQLLQGNVSFNISRLFRWQSSNTLATHHDDSVENYQEVPHFSSPALMEKYAQTEHLNYVYYLRRGQPSFAYANFVAAKLLGHSNTTKRIDHVVSHVYRLALLDFTNSKLSSSCAAFIEMLDRDSTLLRVDTQAALRIVRYSGEEDGRDHSILSKEDGDKHRELATQFIHLFQSPDNVSLSSSLLSKLEQATFNMVKRAGVEICGLEAEECWNLVQSFAHCHRQPPSLEFVKLCAKHGEWLPLLCHAEIFRIPPNKVMGIVERHFSNPCVKEHLQQAISAMERDHLQTPTSPQAEGGEKFRSKRKRLGSSSSRSAAKLQRTEATVAPRTDLRAKFYSKVGLKRDVTPQAAEPSPATPHDDQGKPTEGEEPVAMRTNTSGDIETVVSPAQEREVVFLPPALEEESLPGDLFSVLFKCEGHDSPWRALLAHAVALQRPLLAILAACYEDASMVDCMCVWLIASLGSQVMEKAITVLGISGDLAEDKIRFSAELQWMSWSPFKLGLLLISAMQHSPSPAASFTQALTYFDLHNPLLSFLKFYEEFVLRSNYEECGNYLREFNLSIDKASSVGYGGAVGDLLWVQQVASIMASHMLMVCPTPFERSHLLRLLAEAGFGRGRQFKCHVLDFHNLHQMSLVLSEAGLASDAAFTVKEHFSTTPGLSSLPEVYSVRVRVNTDHVLGLLLEKEQFNIARKYAELVNSTKSQISIKEAEHNLRKISRSSYWRYEQARLNFWYQCDSNFQNAEVDAELASEFFESIVSSLSEDVPQEGAMESEVPSPSLPACSAKDRALLLALALKWRKESKTSSLTLDQVQECEREIWVEHIRAAMEASNSIGKGFSSPLPFLPEVEHCSSILPIYNQSSLLSSLSISALDEYKGRRQLSELLLPDSGPVALEKKGGRGSSLTDKECEAFDQILGRLLNAGLLSQARELADIFNHNSADLTIVLCCIQLAMGKLKPDQLTESVLSLVSARPPQQLTDPSLLAMPDDSQHNRPSAEIIKMMVSLSDRATYAQQCCTTIIVCFRLAVALKVPYASVIVNDPFETLTKLLSSKLSEKYQLASKFVNVCNLEASEVGGFISNKVAEALRLQHLHSPAEVRDSLEAQVYNPKMTSTEFAELAKLCQDQSALGSNLLSMAKSLSDQPSLQNLTIQVEFLVRAHDCYTLGCSVGGIADLLVTAQSTTTKLVAGKHFKLMVRLLIGIGRFKEMSYIIGLLMQHDEFESLLSYKGSEKKEQLRIAIMDYLNHHSREKEKLERLQLVALKFKMFRELAKVKEKQALKDLKKIKPKSLAPNNPETVKNLKNVFEGFKAAAKFYSQEDCLASAEQCYSMARLVALQLSVLQQSKQVINLEAKGVRTQMEELPFTEALIVSDAYKQTMWIDWISPLYKKVIIRGDFQYLGQYKSAFPLTPSLFQELASKYTHDREKSPEAAGNMKKVLTHLKNLPLKKSIAQQLGMNDLLQSLSATHSEGFLNDIARL